MTILAIETSCDETAVAILRDRELVASEVASQISEHAKFGGVVPEVAARNHLVELPRLLGRALDSAKISIREIDAFAATSGPGLASSLLVGNSAAKALAIGSGKPFLAINHLEGHLLSPFFGRDESCSRGRRPRPTMAEGLRPATTEEPRPVTAATGELRPQARIAPNVALIISGGHTLLVNVRAVGDYEILGRTVDDAAGEAFDKVAKLLGLGYLGGPEIERCALTGDATRFELPRSMLGSGDLNFSFSGLKTAVRYLLRDLSLRNCVIPSEVEGSRGSNLKGNSTGSLDFARDDVLNDLCASFQQAVIDVLRGKSLAAVRKTKARCLTLSGGVSCNVALRENLRAACEKDGIELLIAEPWLCTDNAAMIAFAAMLRFRADFVSQLSNEIDPNLALADSG